MDIAAKEAKEIVKIAFVDHHDIIEWSKRYIDNIMGSSSKLEANFYVSYFSFAQSSEHGARQAFQEAMYRALLFIHLL